MQTNFPRSRQLDDSNDGSTQQASPLTEDAVQSLPVHPDAAHALVNDPSFDARLADLYGRRVYQAWKEAATVFMETDRSGAIDHVHLQTRTLLILLKYGISLSDEARSDLVDFIGDNGNEMIRQCGLDFLLTDLATPADVFRRLPLHLLATQASRAIAHPNCPQNVWKVLGRNPLSLFVALSSFQLPADRVRFAFDKYIRGGLRSDALQYIVRQDTSTPEMWLEALTVNQPWQRADVLLALAGNPNARQLPEVRTALLRAIGILKILEAKGSPKPFRFDRSASVEAAICLLRDRRPKEFETLILSVFKRDRRAAIRLLQDDGIPFETPVPRQLLSRLLASKRKEERLLGITLLSSFGDVEHVSEFLDSSRKPHPSISRMRLDDSSLRQHSSRRRGGQENR